MTKDKNIEKELVSLTSKLISFKTVSGNFNEINKCIAFVKNYFKGFKVQELTQNKVKSLIISVDGKNKKEIFLTGHIDVVPAESNQFTPKIKHGKIFGRGSWDMKSGAAIGMLLMKNLKPKNVSLILTGDEELGGQNGMGYIVKKGFSAKFVVALECSGEEISIKNKGVVWLKIKSKGKSAHGSRPWDGINAAENLISCYSEIKKLFPKIKKSDSKTKKWQKTINLGMISAGSGAFNKVPDYSEIGLDIRYNEKDNPDAIINKIKKIAKKYSGYIELIEKEPMNDTKESNVYVKTLKKISRRQTKKTEGASDTRYFAEQKIPVVDFGPDGKNYHGKDEYVIVKSMLKVYIAMEKFINQVGEK